MTAIFELTEAEREHEAYLATLEEEPEDYDEMTLDEQIARGLAPLRDFRQRVVLGLGQEGSDGVRVQGGSLRATFIA